MSLNLIKLCVGCESVGDLEQWIVERSAQARAMGLAPEHFATTRMAPKRREVLDGGSLYWVIKGHIACRQLLLDLQPFTDADGVGRVRLMLDARVIPVTPRRFRPFQGWRYLEGKDAPPDLAGDADVGAMPEDMQRDLAALGLL